ncbi:MAG TPA: ThuA domain-containing protein [Prolixibacteraceae bacterium]|nr:ThuA domain-containing protein [Prolixibacteraceae bacterium]
MISLKYIQHLFTLFFLFIFLTLNQIAIAQIDNNDKEAQLASFVPKKAPAKPSKKRNILIYNVTKSFYHADAILWATKAIELMGEKTGAYTTMISSDPSIFTKEGLSRFDAVVLNNAQGNFCGEISQAEPRKQALIDFVQEGKGIIAIHATTAYDNSPSATLNNVENSFREMIGGSLVHHPWNYDEYSPLTIRIEDPKHSICKAFGDQTKWLLPFRDEIFQFSELFSREKVRVLLSLSLEETADKGSKLDKDYPLAWIKNFGKGRVFYSAFGHSGDTFRNKEILAFLLSGIQFATGDLNADVTPMPKYKIDFEKGFVSIFNGENLKGWRGESRIWSVEDNTITGRTTEKEGVAINNYLIWEGGEVRDFELKAKFKLIGGNSGVYFHSFERTPDSTNTEALVGVQADFSDDPNYAWVGVIMEYKGREKLAERGRKVVIKEDGTRVDAGAVGDPTELLKAYKARDWNEYHIIVRDNLILLRINDIVMSEIRDYDVKRFKSGFLALQVHVGPAMKVQFKDLRLKTFE